jgi:hypothetical protein
MLFPSTSRILRFDVDDFRFDGGVPGVGGAAIFFDAGVPVHRRR